MMIIRLDQIICLLMSLPLLSMYCQKNGAGPEGNRNQLLTGPYLGQQPPGMTPVVFAANIISTDRDWAISFSADGRECFFTRSLSMPTIMMAREENGSWIGPEIASFSGDYLDIEPHFAPGGDTLYFGSERPLPDGGTSGLHQWITVRTENGWSDPCPMDPPLRDIFMMYPSVANNGNLYFTASDGFDQWISVSKFINGNYQEPERLGENINSLQATAHPFISPDESYLIYDAVTGARDGHYICDLYISFRNPDSSWGDPAAMGDPINTDDHECCAFVTLDGAYLFFYREPNIFWVDAQVIEYLRPGNPELYGGIQ